MERINQRRKQLRECFEEGNGHVDNYMELAVLTLDDVIELVIAAIDTAMSYLYDDTIVTESNHYHGSKSTVHDKELVSYEQVCSELGIKEDQMRRYEMKGYLKPVIIDGKRYYYTDDVERLTDYL